jgi:hypothetical protein
MRPWPGNNLGRLTEADRILHDHLCELLSDWMNEADVCTASVGIWGALSVMRDQLNLVILERDANQTRIKDLSENIERLSQLSIDLNIMAKERDALKAALDKARQIAEGK